MSTDADTLLSDLRNALGAPHVLTGDAAAPYRIDWMGDRRPEALAVLRPADTGQVSAILQAASRHGTPVVPISGNTGLTHGTDAGGGLLLSLDRLNTIREIRPDARVAVVEAGVILAHLHEAAEAHDLIFPLTFGARGSAMIGGALSTNAGGSNVVRYGSTRGLCLGIEAVMADGRVLDQMSAVHKDNSGYDLRDLLIGAEGTLGIITAAVLKLVPRPRAYVSAMAACPSIDAALKLLHRLQAETANSVEAFELMPGNYIDAHLTRHPDARAPFDDRHDVNIFLELGALSARDATPDATGAVPMATHLETVLSDLLEAGDILDATVAQNAAQRSEMWARREAAAELTRLHSPVVDNDIAVPLDRMADLIEGIEAETRAIDPGIRFLHVAHLGDGNLHFSGWPSTDDTEAHAAVVRAVEDLAISLGGSFSAEHGVGLSKRPAMARHKDPVALDIMRSIKAALDPQGILNPGKVLPPSGS